MRSLPFVLNRTTKGAFVVCFQDVTAVARETIVSQTFVLGKLRNRMIL